MHALEVLSDPVRRRSPGLPIGREQSAGEFRSTVIRFEVRLSRSTVSRRPQVLHSNGLLRGRSESARPATAVHDPLMRGGRRRRRGLRAHDGSPSSRKDMRHDDEV